MIRNKGFTLIELLGVITLIAIISIITMPAIVNQVKKNKDNVLNQNRELAKATAMMYVKNNPNKYTCATYTNCVKTIMIAELINEGLINLNLKLSSNDNLNIGPTARVIITIQDKNNNMTAVYMDN